ncbi:hypothetical protein T06_14158 [Trichinella sp. T6]|nr:hypothetical protein T06_14158 [Trichinella sp. T6]
MGTVRTFFCISRERRNRELPAFVCCTFLIVFDRLMIIDSILDSKITVLQKCIPDTNAITITYIAWRIKALISV